MKKIIINLFITLFFLFIIIIGILSTIGIETNKLNKIISNKISQSQNIKTNLNIGLGQVLSSPFLSLAPDQYLNNSFKKLEELYD